MREVAVIGIGQSTFGKFPQKTATELGREAVLAAIKDAGIKPRDIQVAYTARLYDCWVTGQCILSDVGIHGIEMINVENACAGGATAFRGVWKEIADGRYDIGIAIGVESMTTSPVAGKLIPPDKDDLEGQLGLTTPGLFALIARRQIELFGTTMEDFAMVSVKNHHHGCLNPFAQYRKEFTVEEVLNSRMICDPITLLQCCPNTDGAAAAILCSMNVAKKHTTKPIKVIASVLLSGSYKYRQEDITISPLGTNAAKMAYEMAGIGPEDINVIELHDASAMTGAHLDATFSAKSVRSVEKQVQEQLSQALMVPTYAGKTLVEPQGELDVPKAALTVDQLDRIRNHLCEVGRAFNSRIRGRVISREVQQVANGVMDPLGLALNSSNELLLFVSLEVAQLHQVDQAADRCEWISDLMRNAGGESPDGRQTRAPN